jgi:ribosomal-protein-alanine N-acetyltransferase
VSAPTETSIRPLAPEDVDAVAAIHVTAFEERTADATLRAQASLREELSRPWARVRVAHRDGVIVGAAVAWIVADEVHVLDVATAPEHRRQGIGRALVADVVELAREQRALQMYLEVRRSNAAAIALYRGAGFAATGVRARYYSDDEDAVEMALSFDRATLEVVRRVDEVEV